MSSQPSIPVLRQAAFLLWMANLVFAAVVGANWLAHVPDVGLKLWLFALPALISTVLTLTLLPGLGFVLAVSWVRSPRVLWLSQAFVWTIFQILVFADTRIYNVFRYHFNGQVLNLVYTRGSEDSIHLGWQVYTAISMGLLGVGALQTWLWHHSQRLAAHSLEGGRRFHLLRPSIVWGAFLLPAVFVEKTIYAQADLNRDRQITALAKLFPLYARVPMEDLASRVLGVEVDKPPRVELEGFELNYPLARPNLDPGGPRPNVLVVVIDCLRQDMLAADTTPRLKAWSHDARRFEDHVSGGNSTRYGLFSLFYGLHGSYWFPFLQEGRAPVLMETLEELDYDIGVFSSASLNYPELRSTAFSTCGDRVYDAFPGKEPWRRDVQAGRAMVEWLEERDSETPFFGFILLDSPHQTYSHPPGATPFSPSARDVDYMSLTRNEGPEAEVLEQVRNRYKNAVHHADKVAGGILAALEANGQAQETLVVVTGDHGEEFRECGLFGHTSAFSAPQVAVPFLMRGPGIDAGVEHGPTSHLDFAPTLMELLGADPAERSAWTLGASLLDPPADRRRVLSGWNELGVWTPEGILRVPLNLFEFDVELYDESWQLQLDDEDVLERESHTLARLGAECNRFLLKGTREP